MSTFDLIIGDFGRSATIRYLAAFSIAEREYLEAHGAVPFYDEYRLVEYCVLGVLPSLKHDLIARCLAETHQLTDKVLLGVGAPPDVIWHNVLNILETWLPPLLDSSHGRVRIVVPCNTLSGMARRIDAIFNGGDSLGPGECRLASLSRARPNTRVEAFGVVDVVADHLATLGLDQLTLVGTVHACDLYRAALSQRHSGRALAISQVSEERFGHVLRDAIEGKHAPSGMDARGPILSACTDFAFSGTMDSLSIYAELLVKDAYGRETAR